MAIPDNSRTTFGWRRWASGVLFVVTLFVIGITPAESTTNSGHNTACVSHSR